MTSSRGSSCDTTPSGTRYCLPRVSTLAHGIAPDSHHPRSCGSPLRRMVAASSMRSGSPVVSSVGEVAM